ncbi:MAG: hypothetical protein SH859_02985 [Hyphomicrobium aestuarii]|nr:hypothetical protein [Hyphomicrobium aestuarii]
MRTSVGVWLAVRRGGGRVRARDRLFGHRLAARTPYGAAQEIGLSILGQRGTAFAAADRPWGGHFGDRDDSRFYADWFNAGWLLNPTWLIRARCFHPRRVDTGRFRDRIERFPR